MPSFFKKRFFTCIPSWGKINKILEANNKSIRKSKTVKKFVRRHFNIIIFPLLAVLLVFAVYWDNQEVFAHPDASMYTYLDNMRYGRIGYGLESGSVGNDISFKDIKMGDIILGGYPGCAYGRFSHAAIYVGKFNVI